MNFKEINIGSLIKQVVIESQIETSRICNFLKCSEKEIDKMYQQKSIDSELLLNWSKLLDYDFFRIYTQHIILYAPMEKRGKDQKQEKSIHHFRKNIYTKGLIDFILEQINNGKMTKTQVIEKYNIPKTTLYKWINKYEKGKHL